jgi:hypothetical protein
VDKADIGVSSLFIFILLAVGADDAVIEERE